MRFLNYLSCIFTDQVFTRRERTAVCREISFAEAIAAHRAWKKQLIDSVTVQQEPIRSCEDVKSDSHCTLGQWIHGAGRRRYGNLQSFDELRERHAHFHRLASEIVILSHGNQMPKAQHLIETEFKQASNDIIARLEHLNNLFAN